MIGKLLQIRGVQRLIAALSRVPAIIVLGLCLALILILGVIHYWVADPSLAWIAFYLVPIAGVTWFIGARPGGFTAFLSAVALYIVLFLLRVPLLDGIWNAVVMWIVGGVVVELLHSVKISHEVGKQLSRIDSATGAINTRFFMELLEAEFHRAERYRFALTLAYINLKDFDQLNERLGSQAGDELLYEFVMQLSEALRANDVVARLGRDKFALLLPQTNDTQAQQVFARLQPHLKAALAAEAVPVEYQIAVGTFLDLPETAEALTEQVDLLLQSVKAEEKSLVYQVFHEDLSSAL